MRQRFEKALGGPAAARRGRFGVDVDHGKVARDHPQVDAPESITLAEALELIAERAGRPVRQRKSPAKAAAGQENNSKKAATNSKRSA